jgi:hypothetical protein
MTYPIRVISDGDTAWGADLRFAIAGVNDHQTRVTALEASASTLTANTQTGTSYTLVLGDAGKCVEMNNASANTLTIPLNASVGFPTGTVIELYQVGAGQTTVAITGGGTLRAPDGAKLSKQFASASLRKRGTDEWVLAGSVTT